MTTDQKGAIAETAIVHEAVKLGFDVYKPINDGSRCDLVMGVHGELLRLQCKWVRRRGEVIPVRCYSSRRSRNGFVRKCYTPQEVDALAAYCADLERCFIIPIAHFRGAFGIQLRLSASRNNQRVGVHWADDFDFTARLRALGAVAQLGEH